MGDSISEIMVSRASEKNFGFAFNDSDFSDRVLNLEIIPDESVDSSKKPQRKTRKRKKNDSGSYGGAKVVSLHIISAILALKSPFFFKLFKNGMRESQQKSEVSLRINASEEESLMDLLKFMYENTLSAKSAPDLMNVLMVADKFEVFSCMRYSIEMLLKLPMSLENALVYLELPPSVLMNEIVKPLIDEAKKYVAARYNDFTKFQEEATELPLSVVDVVLGSEGLQVNSEDDVYEFILKWARAHYPELEERREILTKRLVRLVCFQNMSTLKLKEALACPDFEHEQVSKLVVEALFSKVEHSCGHYIHDSKDLATTYRGFLGRVYRPSCIVYFDLKKDELKSLPETSKGLRSQPFYLGGKQLFLWAIRKDCFALYMHRVQLQGSETCTLDFEIAVMNKSSNEFESKHKVNNHTLGDNGWGRPDLLRISWTEFLSDDSDWFIDGILRIRAEITLVNNS